MLMEIFMDGNSIFSFDFFIDKNIMNYINDFGFRSFIWGWFYESGDYNGADTYVVDYKQSTEEGYNKALSLQENKPDVDWHEFNDENISKYIAR